MWSLRITRQSLAPAIARILAAEDDIRIVGQPQFLEQLLNVLDRFRVHLLVIAAGFSSAFPEIQSIAARHSTGILGVADGRDEASALIAMGIRGVVYRSAEPATVIVAVRRLVCGESFVHTPNKNAKEVGEDLGMGIHPDCRGDIMLRLGVHLSPYKNHLLAGIAAQKCASLISYAQSAKESDQIGYGPPEFLLWRRLRALI
jgi:hypothetical protein